MVDPVITGAAIAGGSNILGGVLGSRGAKAEARRGRKLQMHMMKHGIEERVGDARRAGVHPLFALGASTGSFTPTAQPISDGSGIAAAGEAIGNAVASRSQRRLALEDAKAGIQVKKAQASYYESMAAASLDSRVRQGSNSQQDLKARVAAGTEKPPKVTLHGPANTSFKTSATTPVQDVEDHYGEVLSLLTVSIVLYMIWVKTLVLNVILKMLFALSSII